MNAQLLFTFIILNILNVIIQTIKSIATVKCGKGIASIINAVAYGLYTIVTVYMMCELPLLWKAGIVALCNLIGVYAVKLGEEKSRKDKLWKVEATVSKELLHAVETPLLEKHIPHNCLRTTGDYAIFNIFCATQKESTEVKKILDKYKAKYFVSESKNL